MLVVALGADAGGLCQPMIVFGWLRQPHRTDIGDVEDQPFEIEI